MHDKIKSINPYLKGFTLLEILIVILIIGIISSVAVISFGDFGGKRRVFIFAEEFLSSLKFMQNQAIIESNPIGIQINATNYQIYQLNDEFKWKPAAGPLFSVLSLPNNVTFKLTSNLKNTVRSPGIIIDNSGEINSFELQIGTSQHPQLVTLINDSFKGLRFASLQAN